LRVRGVLKTEGPADNPLTAGPLFSILSDKTDIHVAPKLPREQKSPKELAARMPSIPWIYLPAEVGGFVHLVHNDWIVLGYDFAAHRQIFHDKLALGGLRSFFQAPAIFGNYCTKIVS
jgi:hypothetical protein